MAQENRTKLISEKTNNLFNVIINDLQRQTLKVQKTPQACGKFISLICS